MKPRSKELHFNTIIILIVILLTACNNSKEIHPFPTSENEYEQPVTKSFELSEPDTLVWITKGPSQIKPFPKKNFSWSKIPSKPFDIGLPYALKAPLTKKSFDWNSLPATPFNLESLPKKDLKIKATVLGEPKIVKALSPVVPPLSSPGVKFLPNRLILDYHMT
jgi:hypothetical protein